jgi:hypothetical protein
MTEFSLCTYNTAGFHYLCEELAAISYRLLQQVVGIRGVGL